MLYSERLNYEETRVRIFDFTPAEARKRRTFLSCHRSACSVKYDVIITVKTYVLSPEDLLDDESKYDGVSQQHQDNRSHKGYQTWDIRQPTTVT